MTLQRGVAPWKWKFRKYKIVFFCRAAAIAALKDTRLMENQILLELGFAHEVDPGFAHTAQSGCSRHRLVARARAPPTRQLAQLESTSVYETGQ